MGSAVVLDLPRHDLPFEKPPQSEVITLSSGETAYAWELTPSERSHIAEMLNVENFMSHDREECRTCSKHMGLDDMVHNAKYAGVHGTAFILDVFRNGNKNESPAHAIFCSRCTSRFRNALAWRFDPDAPWSD
ncbi:RBP protein [Aspergillus germanicus]